jgi:hypothetical protein
VVWVSFVCLRHFALSLCTQMRLALFFWYIIHWLIKKKKKVNNLCGFTTAKTMWDYLRQIYYQNNSTRKFQLELDTGNYR